jgi:hypothetical protein
MLDLLLAVAVRTPDLLWLIFVLMLIGTMVSDFNHRRQKNADRFRPLANEYPDVGDKPTRHPAANVRDSIQPLSSLTGIPPTSEHSPPEG